MKTNDIDKSNKLVKKFEQYLLLNYSNDKTRELYLKELRRFLSEVSKITNKEPEEVSQELIDRYVIFLRSKIRPNPFYIGFIKAWRDCFDPEDEFGKRHLAFKLPKNKSREVQTANEYDWMTEDTVRKIIEEGSTYISLTTQIYFETGLRKMELINLNLNTKESGLDLEKRRMAGIGKGNKPFIVHFSEGTADRLKVWLTECPDPTRPFMIFKKSGEPYVNQDKEMWSRFKKECKRLGILSANGEDIPHTHTLRHSLGRHLRRDKKWDVVQVAKKLRHTDPKTTMRYSDSTMEEIEKMDEETFRDAKYNEKTDTNE